MGASEWGTKSTLGYKRIAWLYNPCPVGDPQQITAGDKQYVEKRYITHALLGVPNASKQGTSHQWRTRGEA